MHPSKFRPRLLPIGAVIGTIILGVAVNVFTSDNLTLPQRADQIASILGALVGIGSLTVALLGLRTAKRSEPSIHGQSLESRVRRSRNELVELAQQLGHLMEKPRALLKELDVELNERDQQIAERNAELERLALAATLTSDQIKVLEQILDQREQAGRRINRKRDLILLGSGALLGALLGIPGSWIADLIANQF